MRKVNGSTQVKLEKQLELYKKKLDLPALLRVVCMPNSTKNLVGQIKGSNIYIYEPSEVEAVKVLAHEIVDYCISQAIEPYKEVTNRLIKMINDDAYKRKEKVVEALSKLLIKVHELME